MGRACFKLVFASPPMHWWYRLRVTYRWWSEYFSDRQGVVSPVYSRRYPVSLGGTFIDTNSPICFKRSILIDTQRLGWLLNRSSEDIGVCGYREIFHITPFFLIFNVAFCSHENGAVSSSLLHHHCAGRKWPVSFGDQQVASIVNQT